MKVWSLIVSTTFSVAALPTPYAIAQQKNLPRKFWRDNPGDQRRRPAQESAIEEKPLIQALDLYRYAK